MDRDVQNFKGRRERNVIFCLFSIGLKNSLFSLPKDVSHFQNLDCELLLTCNFFNYDLQMNKESFSQFSTIRYFFRTLESPIG